jgi:hypothetical protein
MLLIWTYPEAGGSDPYLHTISFRSVFVLYYCLLLFPKCSPPLSISDCSSQLSHVCLSASFIWSQFLSIVQDLSLFIRLIFLPECLGLFCSFPLCIFGKFLWILKCSNALFNKLAV